MQGTYCMPSIKEKYREDVRETVAKCLENPGEVVLVEIKKPAKDRDVTTIWNFVALTDANGVPEEIQCIGIDISIKKIKEEAIRKKQEELLLSISTPITQLWDDILFLPLVGTMDAKRSKEVISMTLDSISQTQAKVFILDIGGVTVVDTSTANYFIQLAKAIRLMGCHCTISGISAAVAQTVVELGIDTDELHTTGNLKTALESALVRTSSRLTKV